MSVRVDGISLSLLSGQFNDDPAVDLVSLTDVGNDGPSLSVLLNRGDGTFTAVRPVVLDPTRFITQALAAGDLDGDALSDVAVAVTDLSAPGFASAIVVYTGAGEGRLVDPVVVDASGGQFPSALGIGDINGDQIADLILCDSQVQTGNGRVLLFPGQHTANGSTFGTPTPVITGSLLNQVVVTDLDGDGRTDILLMDSAEGRLIGLYGAASGQWAPVTLAPFDLPTTIVTTNANKDDRLDVVAVSEQSGQITPFLQPERRQFIAGVSPSDPNGFGSIGTADFDGDGRADLVATSRAGDAVLVLRGDGLGSFFGFDSTDIDGPVDQITVADLNGDFRPDIALTRSEDEAISILLNVLPAPPTMTPTPQATATPTVAVEGDANCDGHVDRMDLAALVVRLFNAGCALADVNQDGRVTAADLVRFKWFL